MGSLVAGILAGGLGTRLRSVVSDRPKVLAHVGGRPFLSYLLDQLVAADLRNAVLCTGHLGDRVRTAFGDSYRGIRLRYSREKSPLGTGGALRAAVHLFESDPVLIMNGDSFCEFELEPLCLFHTSRNAEATFVLTQVGETSRYGRVNIETTGRIQSFEEKTVTHGPGWINAGIYLLSRRLLLTIPPDEPISLEHQMFPSWIHHEVYGYCGQGRFLDIGTPESYAAAEQFFA
jgi:D-glycero-alpha-D-manno-heptose 1-phosphate guanylyltransferase